MKYTASIHTVFFSLILYILLMPLLTSAGTYVLDYGTTATLTPADATNGFIQPLNGNSSLSTSCSNSASGQLYGPVVPLTGTITKIRSIIGVGGTFPTTEPSSFWLNVNNADVVILSASSSAMSAAQRNNWFNFDLSYPITAGDVFCIRWLTPIWVTNPTIVTVHFWIVIDDGLTTADTTTLDQTTNILFYILWSFFGVVFFTVWLLRPKH